MKYHIQRSMWRNRNNPYPWQVRQGLIVVAHFRLKREAIDWIMKQEAR